MIPWGELKKSAKASISDFVGVVRSIKPLKSVVGSVETLMGESVLMVMLFSGVENTITSLSWNKSLNEKVGEAMVKEERARLTW